MNRDVERYLKASFFPEDSVLQYEEISEGNINHVYRVRGTKTGNSLVLKRAEKESRISPEIRLSVSRGKREVDYFKSVQPFAPDALPEIYDYNKGLRLIVMEDLSGRYEVLRSAMIAGKRFDFLGTQLAAYLAGTTFSTSDFFLSHQKKKRMQKAFSNPELCALTERLVFTEPFVGANENWVSDRNAQYVQTNVYSNEKLRLIAAKMKLKFMNEAQALIHGDLHFGSVFAGSQHIVVFDPEFCFFGPIGYDLGNLFAHFLMEFIFHSIKEREKKSGFPAWLKQMAEDLMRTFETSFILKAKQACKDQMLAQPGFVKAFVSSVLTDTAGFAGTECLRRTIGIAKIPEFDCLSERDRETMEKQVLKSGIYLMEHMDEFQNAEAFIRFLKDL